MDIQTSSYHLLTNLSQQSGKVTPASISDKADNDQQKTNITISASQNTNATQTEDKTKTNHDKLPSEDELDQVKNLKQRDAEVRAHEAAHLAAAGKYATGSANFEYTRGPDGKSYATAGEVQIDTGPIPNDPEATLQKAQQIQAAAQAPAQPSSQDRQVAAEASVMASEARSEITQKKSDATSEKTNENAKSEYQYIEDIITDEQNSSPAPIDQVA